MLGLGNIIKPSAKLAKDRCYRTLYQHNATVKCWDDDKFNPGGTSDWTFCIWLKLISPAYPNSQGIFRCNNDSNNTLNFMFRDNNDGTDTGVYNVTWEVAGNNIVNLTSSNIPLDDLKNWHQVFFVCDRSHTMKIWLGSTFGPGPQAFSQIGSVDISGFAATNITGFASDESIIGGALDASANTTYLVSAYIGHFAWFRRALSEKEMKAVWNEGKPIDLRYPYSYYTGSSDLTFYSRTHTDSFDQLGNGRDYYANGNYRASNIKLWNVLTPYGDNTWLGKSGDGRFTQQDWNIPINSATFEDVTEDGEHAIKLTRGTSDLCGLMGFDANSYSSLPNTRKEITLQYKCNAATGSVNVYSITGGGNVTQAASTTWRSIKFITNENTQACGVMGINGITSGMSPIWLRRLTVRDHPGLNNFFHGLQISGGNAEQRVYDDGPGFELG